MRMAERFDLPMDVMFHGFAHDHAQLWHESARHILVTAPTIGDMLSAYCDVPRSKIAVVPNGVRDDLLDLPPVTLHEKLVDPHVVVIGRLNHDKLRMVRRAAEVALRLSDRLETRIRLEFLGDGPLRNDFERELRGHLEGTGERVDYTFVGWVSPDEAPARARRALVSVSAGRGALQSLATGTPVAAAGAQHDLGLIGPHDFEMGFESNFGDYAVRRAEPGPQSQLYRLFCDESAYAEWQGEGRALLREGYAQSQIDMVLLRALGLRD